MHTVRFSFATLPHKYHDAPGKLYHQIPREVTKTNVLDGWSGLSRGRAAVVGKGLLSRHHFQARGKRYNRLNLVFVDLVASS